MPNRGNIIDRNGVVLARNYSAYTLEITPSKINGTLDEVIDQLGQVVDIDSRDRRRFKKLLEDSKTFESLPIRTRLTDTEVARFIAQRYRFPGVEVRARLFRQYPLGTTAAHVIGYIGRISQRDQDRIDAASEQNDNDQTNYDPRLDANNYNGTDYIGKIGVEQSYETELHGETGFEEVEVTAGGRPVRTLSRTQAVPGNKLVLSIDAGLQEVAEQAFAGRRGALVAIEPSTGDVLAFVSAPSFDPNLFVDGVDQQTWDQLNNSPDKPLLNRPLRGTYPPGSTYKPFMALAALTLHKRTTQWGFQDTGSYTFAGHTFHNDVRNGQGWIDMNRAIVVSNDDYFYMLAHDLGVNAIADFMRPWGFGEKTGIDVEGEAVGVLPSTDWKRKTYKRPEAQRWYEGETISLGIGQGYNSFTILQLAHAVATLANDGVVMKPHLVKEIENPITHVDRLTVPKPSGRIDVSQQNIDFVKHAMVGVTTNPSGTAYSVFRNAPYVAGGKTGTAQVYSLEGAKYQAHAVAEDRRDHALFTAFAPADQPTIALALVVENGGWGAEAAAPIARKVLDYWLIDRLKPGAEAAAVALAASATAVSDAPVIGGGETALQAALPASLAASAPFAPASAAAVGSASAPAVAPTSASALGSVSAPGSAAASSAGAARAAPTTEASASRAAKPALKPTPKPKPPTQLPAQHPPQTQPSPAPSPAPAPNVPLGPATQPIVAPADQRARPGMLGSPNAQD